MSESILDIGAIHFGLQQGEQTSMTLEKVHRAAHDMRSPLAVLKILLHDSGTALSEDRKDLLLQTINRMNEIVKDLSSLDKLDAKTPAKVNVTKIISKLIEEKKFLNKYRPGIKVEFLGIHTDVSILGSEAEIKRTLSNVIDNAYEALDDIGFVKVSLLQDNGFAQIEITDNGKGIDKSHLAQIFQKGFTQKTGGNGLGLYHARKSIEQMGGSIELESQTYKGTTVRIRIPLG